MATKKKEVSKTKVVTAEDLMNMNQRQPRTAIGRVLGASADAAVGLSEIVVKSTKILGDTVGLTGELNTLAHMNLTSAIHDTQTDMLENIIRNNLRVNAIKDTYDISQEDWDKMSAQVSLDNFK
ncbi:MAG: hypothetical protein FXV80_06525 [Candidatus Thioglobus sp.]|nr:MAG: hypothetical protein FXV80_06525 [Candidatus Thioglobus sp.]